MSDIELTVTFRSYYYLVTNYSNSLALKKSVWYVFCNALPWATGSPCPMTHHRSANVRRRMSTRTFFIMLITRFYEPSVNCSDGGMSLLHPPIAHA